MLHVNPLTYKEEGKHPSLPIAFNRVSLCFLDRLLPNVNVVPSRYWFPLGLPCLKFEPMAARKKGDLVLYSGDLFPTEASKPPSCPRSRSVTRKGKPTHTPTPLILAFPP